jgi:RNA polymerase sigma-70 factor, ECF subfamily
MSNKIYHAVEDERLFHLLCEGNREAFDQIYNRYWNRLFLYIVKAIRDKEAAQDIVQEIFVSLWIRRKEINVNGTLAAYLFTAARYKGISYVQDTLKKSKHAETLATYLVERQDVVNEDYAAKELNAIIEIEIEKLPVKMREVFVLSRQENLSHKEISEKLNISDKTVKKQINNALKHFKLVLNKDAVFLFGFLMLSPIVKYLINIFFS